jgi:hypothetical protein
MRGHGADLDAAAMTMITRHTHHTAIARRPRSRLAALTDTILLAVVVLALVTAATAATAAAAASTGLGRVTTFSARFSTQQAGAASGLVLRTTGRPPRAGLTEAPAVRQTVILAPGTQLRLASLPQCHASDALIAADGAEGACPASSRVGSGGADGLLAGMPVHFDIGIYAVRGHLVLAAERAGVPLKQSFDGVAHGTDLLLTVPTLGGKIFPTGFDARIPARPGARAWLRTPARCPRSGEWTAVGHFQGVSSTGAGGRPVTQAQTLVDRVPCRG